VPVRPGSLTIFGVAFSLTTAVVTGLEGTPPLVRGKQKLVTRGLKLRPLKDKPNENHYAEDKRLNITIVPASPILTVSHVFYFDEPDFI